MNEPSVDDKQFVRIASRLNSLPAMLDNLTLIIASKNISGNFLRRMWSPKLKLKLGRYQFKILIIGYIMLQVSRQTVNDKLVYYTVKEDIFDYQTIYYDYYIHIPT